VGGVQRLLRLVQAVVEPRRGDRRAAERRNRRLAVAEERRTGADRRVRDRRAAI